MSNPHPVNLSIEIDRDLLRRYLRTQAFLAWAAPMCVFGGVLGFGAISRIIERGNMTAGAACALASKAIAIGVSAAFLLAALCYLIVSHRIAARRAATLEVTVEGAFLRVRQHELVETDRKLHFRSIVDYSANQDFLMRQFGIHSLQLATTAGGQNGTLVIPGVKDCLKARDLLAEIDAQRENQ